MPVPDEGEALRRGEKPPPSVRMLLAARTESSYSTLFSKNPLLASSLGGVGIGGVIGALGSVGASVGLVLPVGASEIVTADAGVDVVPTIGVLFGVLTTGVDVGVQVVGLVAGLVIG